MAKTTALTIHSITFGLGYLMADDRWLGWGAQVGMVGLLMMAHWVFARLLSRMLALQLCPILQTLRRPGDADCPAPAWPRWRIVGQLTQAVNQFQAQRREHAAETAAMTAAISHDLQTPITRLRLRADLVTDPEFAQRKNRSANKEKLRAIIAGIFASDRLENWMAKMKKANIPVGYLRTVEEGFNAPEVRDRHRLSQIPHPTAGAVPNIETPLNMSLTPTIDPVAAPLLGEHTKDVLRKTLGYDERRIAALAEAGAFGKTGNTG